MGTAAAKWFVCAVAAGLSASACAASPYDETFDALIARYQLPGLAVGVIEDGKVAYRVDIQLGRQNTDYYEVLSGLKPGDKVVTSSYENYGNMQELVLKR